MASKKSSCHIYNEGETEKHKSEYYGPHGRCFEWKKYNGTGKRDVARCHAAMCKDKKVKIKLGDGRELDCLKSGDTITLEEGYEIKCPDLADFCAKFDKRCPMDCHGNGICLEHSKCFCFGKLKGSSCVSFFELFKIMGN